MANYNKKIRQRIIFKKSAQLSWSKDKAEGKLQSYLRFKGLYDDINEGLFRIEFGYITSEMKDNHSFIDLDSDDLFRLKELLNYNLNKFDEISEEYIWFYNPNPFVTYELLRQNIPSLEYISESTLSNHGINIYQTQSRPLFWVGRGPDWAGTDILEIPTKIYRCLRKDKYELSNSFDIEYNSGFYLKFITVPWMNDQIADDQVVNFLRPDLHPVCLFEGHDYIDQNFVNKLMEQYRIDHYSSESLRKVEIYLKEYNRLL